MAKYTNSHIETDSAEDCPDTSSDLLPDNDNEYRPFIYLMEPALQEENFDGMVICSPKDTKVAKEFVDHLSGDIEFRFSDQLMHPKVKLVDDIRGNECETLDNLIQRSVLTFLYCTRSFCEEAWSEVLSNACLMRALEDKSKRWSVIPVHTQPRSHRDYTLPLLLGAIKPINYFDVDKFYIESLKRMFLKAAPRVMDKNYDLHMKRKRYYIENKTCLISKLHYSGLQKMQRETRVSSRIQVETPLGSRNSRHSQIPLMSNDDNCSLTSSYQSYTTWDSSSCQSSDMDSCLGQVDSLHKNNSSVTTNHMNISCLSINNSQNSSLLPQGRQFIDNTIPLDSHGSKNVIISKESEQTEDSSIMHIHNHFHINDAENVIVGDQGKISIKNERSKSIDTEDESSPLDDDFDYISRQPDAEQSQRQPACNTNVGSVSVKRDIEALPDLMYPLSVSNRNEENEENHSIHLLCDPDDTFVKYSSHF